MNNVKALFLVAACFGLMPIATAGADRSPAVCPPHCGSTKPDPTPTPKPTPTPTPAPKPKRPEK